MTCNMLMVLLDCYRGTFNALHHMGTVHDDLKYLERRELIEWNSERKSWVTTTKGDTFGSNIIILASRR